MKRGGLRERERESDGGHRSSRRAERKAWGKHTAGQHAPPGGEGAGVSGRERPLQGEGASVRQTANAHSGGPRGVTEQRKRRTQGWKRPVRSLPAPSAAPASHAFLSSVYFKMSPALLHPLLPLQTFARG